MDPDDKFNLIVLSIGCVTIVLITLIMVIVDKL